MTLCHVSTATPTARLDNAAAGPPDARPMNANGSSTSTSAGRPARLAIPARHAASASVDLPLVDSAVSATDPVLEELARLEELRQSVRQNLQLRQARWEMCSPVEGEV